MRHAPPRAEIDPAQWNARVEMIWARFSDEEAPVLGWLREGVHSYRDAFFSSDGTLRAITRDALRTYQLPYSILPDRPQPPRGIALHPALRYQITDVLKTRDYLRDPRNNAFYPIASEKDWRRISRSRSSLTIDYHFMCDRCHMIRVVRRTDSAAVDALPADHEFRCEDVGIECDVPHLIPCELIPRVPRPLVQPETAPHAPPIMEESANAFVEPEPGPGEGYGNVWRRRMKHWIGITSYDGSASLVELRGWRTMVEEGYDRVGVPEGRDCVLQAIKYLTGDAEKWWRSVAGQPRGQSLQTFKELYEELERRFIPCSVHEKAVKEWNSLKQTGTAEEYMRRVDELATVKPLGEVAEFWHAWEGMRPELKAEVQFRLQEQGRETCSRDELWTLMWNAETRYPHRLARPFPSCAPFRSANLRAAATGPSSSVVC